MDNTIYIGVDPGKKGAIVFLHADGTVLQKNIIPLIGNQIDLRELKDIVCDYDVSNKHFIIEDVHAIFGSAAGATFAFGYVFGAITATICACGYKFTLVQPKAWQKVMFQGIPEIRKPDIRTKAGKTIRGRLDTKPMAELAAKRLFPSLVLQATTRSTKSHDGIVDALLLAEYGRRSFR